MQLTFVDHRQDPASWARHLDVPREAIDLYLASDVIDLHVCSFTWMRWGYDLSRRHRAPRRMPFLNQVDFPRAREAAMTGVVWDITTNPFRTETGRRRAFFKNLSRLRRQVERHPADLRLVRSLTEYREARAAGLLACWLSVQGGNALDESVDFLDQIPDDVITRITLVHFTRSKIGYSSASQRGLERGLTPFGRSFVERMVDRKILVDLSHIGRAGFFDALDVVPEGVPVVVTHTGVSALCPSFRNLDDEQIRAVAETGGTIGIIYQAPFLQRQSWYDYPLARIVDHMEHVIGLVGDDHVSIGSDMDGAVILPRDMRDITEMPRLVAEMLRRGWSAERIQKILGLNYLRAVGEVRP